MLGQWIRWDRHHPRQEEHKYNAITVRNLPPKGTTERKIFICRSNKNWERGKGGQQRKREKRGGEGRGGRNRWSREEQQRESPDTPADHVAGSGAAGSGAWIQKIRAHL